MSTTAARRPAYVPADFGGKCKHFPAATSGGKAPLLLPYQARWVKDNSRLKIAEKSRQIGWTWASAYRLVSTKCLATARLDAWVSSRDDVQAQLFLQDCKAFAGLLKIGAEDLGHRFIDPQEKHSSYTLRFASGCNINSMSSNPDAQAGKRGDRVLDEFALHRDQRQLYGIAYPGITWGGSLEIFSTHRGSGSFFNGLLTEAREKNRKGFSVHRVTLQDSLEQGFLYKLQSKLPETDARLAMDEGDYFDFIRAGCADEEMFQQEYCCVPSDDKSAFVTYELLDGAAASADWARPLEQCTGALYAGVDIGRDHDLTCIWVAERREGVLQPCAVIEMEAESFAAQEARLYPLLALPNLRRCCIDQTGIGRQFAERAQERFGYRVEGVTFTGPVKEGLAYPLRAALEDKTFAVPRADKIFADFRAIKKETTQSGNVRFAADRGKNGHSDRFWAAALCLHAAAKSTAAGAWTADSLAEVNGAMGARRATVFQTPHLQF